MDTKEEDMHGEKSSSPPWKEDEKKYGKHGWKLVEINRKYIVLEESSSLSSSSSPKAILDLCAAPGEWMKVAVDKAPKGCFVLGVDILPIINININIPPSGGGGGSTAFSVQQDITAPNSSEAIKRVMEEHRCGEFDVVLSDGVPNSVPLGPWCALTVQSIKLATHFLAPNGTFVTKAYRSQDFYPVLYCLDKLFEKFKVVDFAHETYLVGLKYKAPSSIDPRLLDTRHLLRKGPEFPKGYISLSISKKTPKRNLIRVERTKVCCARKFVSSDTPLKLLSSISRISFRGAACVSIKNHNLTTDEVKDLCFYIPCLSKQQIKHLIMWHITIKKALTPVRKAAPLSTEVEPKSTERKVVKMLREMVELIYAMDRKKNRAKKLIAKQQSEDKSRTAMGMQMDAVVDGYGGQEQFTLSTVKGKKDLGAVDEIVEDSEEKRKKYHEHLEDLLDQAYEIFFEKKYGSIKQKKRKENHYEVSFDDDVYDDEVLAKLFCQCIFDDNVDEVENKTNSDGEETRGKGKASSKQGKGGKGSSDVILKENEKQVSYFDSTEKTLPQAKGKQVPASGPSKEHKHRESGKGSVGQKRKYKKFHLDCYKLPG